MGCREDLGNQLIFFVFRDFRDSVKFPCFIVGGYYQGCISGDTVLRSFYRNGVLTPYVLG